MSKTTKLNKAIILSVKDDKLTAEKMFNRVLKNFIRTPTGRTSTDVIFKLLETLILTGIIIETIIKNKLRTINPALILESVDPVNIALVSGKKKKLIDKCEIRVSDIKSAPITTLLDRFSKFFDTGRYLISLRNYFTLRNKIVHSAQNVSLEENKIALLLTKSIFPFIRQYVDAEEQTWIGVEKIAFVAHDMYKANLVREILEYRKRARKISPDKVKQLIMAAPKIQINESVLGENLICPACHNASMDFITGVEAEYEGPGEYSVNEYNNISCRVCEIALEKSDIEEIIKNSEHFFSPSEDQLAEWRDVLYSNWEEYSDLI